MGLPIAYKGFKVKVPLLFKLRASANGLGTNKGLLGPKERDASKGPPLTIFSPGGAICTYINQYVHIHLHLFILRNPASGTANYLGPRDRKLVRGQLRWFRAGPGIAVFSSGIYLAGSSRPQDMCDTAQKRLL